MMKVDGSMARSRLMTWPGEVGVAVIDEKPTRSVPARPWAISSIVVVAQLALGAASCPVMLLHHAPEALGGHVARLGVGVQPGGVGRHLAEAARGDSVLETDHLDAQ